MSRLFKTLLLGSGIIISGTILCLSPAGRYLEENMGLSILFKLRGTRTPPSEVAIIAIDQESARQLKLSPKSEKWPRSLHTEFLKHLAGVGAKVIAFDIIFREKRDESHDRALAESIKTAGNVVLVELMRREKIPVHSDSGQSTGQLEIIKRVQPINRLKDVSAASAPFPIPKVPVKVSRYWAFISDAGNTPSLPIVTFQIFAREAYGQLVELLRQTGLCIDELPLNDQLLLASGGVERVLRMIRDKFEADPGLADALIEKIPASAGASEKQGGPLLDRLIRMYAAPDGHFLNYYGPPGTIHTISYHQLISRKENRWVVSDLSEFKGKAVFIGLSERQAPLKTDGFYTVYSQPDGVDLNGVEIAATAFANILENKPVRPLSSYFQIGVLILCGCLLVLICSFSSNIAAAAGALTFCFFYLLVSRFYFKSGCIWLPVFTVIFFQAPLAFVVGILIRYTDVNKERKAIRDAFKFYLPPEIVDRIAIEKGKVTGGGQMVHGAILCTDLEKYTSFSETTDPKSLNRLMHKYFETIFEPVQEHGGIISDLTGDSMMALWATKEPEISSRYRACESAVQICAALSGFWKNSELPVHLPTRIGIHYGHVHLGNVGAGNHYEYKITGDAVNTVSRIENLNKHLRTRTLVSADALKEVDGFLTRRVGTFLLSGKSKSVEVFELLDRFENATDRQKDLVRMFADGLNTYLDRSWEKALQAFELILNRFPDDGPTLLYSSMCHNLRETPPDTSWNGVVIAAKK
ncbi:MAG: adenylate/guanylate cyclase domain-containing protein [Thermodesulfobacteriota bacterium]|nr:adenylate/guanylate cyclase domain-containing protein [Thermodesulfobacteriota bacterium]